MTDTRQALAALLPCPFCGNSKGLAVANENPQDLSGGYFIACPSCDASTGLRFACGEDPIPLLIEQWNRRAALSAQPVAGAVATDETGWLIEHSGEILPGAEQRAQVSWLRVQMKFNGYGAREFGFTHDANEALRFARKEDAEAVLAMHLGASPPDWYSKPFSVTEHMWPAAPQAAPEPEPSAPIDAFKLYAELRDLVAEAGAGDTMIGRPEVLRSRLSALCKRVGQLTTDLPIGTAPAPEPSAQAVAHPSHQTVREWMPVSEALRLSDLWTTGDLDNCGQWRAAIKVLADEVRALAASPQPEPSAQAVMMELEQRLIEIAKALPPMTTLGWNDGGMCEPDEAIKGYTKKQVLEILAQHLSTSSHPEPSAQGEQVATVTEKMVTAYLTANDAYWKRIDGEPTKLGKWRNGTPSEATRVSLMAALAAAPSTPPHADPIDMVLHCPACGLQHIDAPDERTPDWKNEPHRSHLCHGCGHIWRPADVPTNGVQATKTKGKADSPPHAVVEAVPLNFDQLQSVMSQHFGGRELTDDEADSAEAFARAIERAHGIAPKAAQP